LKDTRKLDQKIPLTTSFDYCISNIGWCHSQGTRNSNQDGLPAKLRPSLRVKPTANRFDNFTNRRPRQELFEEVTCPQGAKQGDAIKLTDACSIIVNQCLGLSISASPLRNCGGVLKNRAVRRWRRDEATVRLSVTYWKWGSILPHILNLLSIAMHGVGRLSLSHPKIHEIFCLPLCPGKSNIPSPTRSQKPSFIDSLGVELFRILASRTSQNLTKDSSMRSRRVFLLPSYIAYRRSRPASTPWKSHIGRYVQAYVFSLDSVILLGLFTAAAVALIVHKLLIIVLHDPPSTLGLIAAGPFLFVFDLVSLLFLHHGLSSTTRAIRIISSFVAIFIMSCSAMFVSYYLQANAEVQWGRGVEVSPQIFG
jgi:hypothetical protein